MANTKQPNEKKPGAKKSGNDEYNPVNMAGRKAGIVEEREQAKSAERSAEHGAVDNTEVPRDQRRKGNQNGP